MPQSDTLRQCREAQRVHTVRERRDTFRYRRVDATHGSHHKILDWIGSKSRVLDVGCATGYLSELLRTKGCEVYGVESDKTAATYARGSCVQVVEGDIEDVERLPWPLGFFDFIICADLLEHLKAPEVVLQRLKPYLRDPGHLVVSIPNIAYWRVRASLLVGVFDYTETGILDRTHLHFYTLRTSKELISAAGYDIEETDFTGWAMQYYPLRFFPSWFAYQQLILAKPRKRT